MTHRSRHAGALLRGGVVLLGVPLVLACAAASAAAQPAGARVASADHAPFTISGSLSAALFPGRSGPLDLRLANPNDVSLRLTGLTVAITGIQPLAGLACSVDDFAVEQFDPEDEIILKSESSERLSELGLTTGRLPRLRMLETGVNQSGCAGATYTLAYSGTAIGEVHTSGDTTDSDDDYAGVQTTVDLPGTGSDGHGGFIALAGAGLVAVGAGTLHTLRRRKVQA